MRKAQIQGQIVVYILAAVVVTLVLFYGYNAINDLNKKSATVSLVKFEKDISAQVRAMSSEYGSTSKETIEVPSGFEQICFVDLEKCNKNLHTGCPLQDDHPLIYDSYDSNTMKNVFLKSRITSDSLIMEESFYIPFMTVSDGESTYYFCKDIDNHRVDIKIEGFGNTAEITPD